MLKNKVHKNTIDTSEYGLNLFHVNESTFKIPSEPSIKHMAADANNWAHKTNDGAGNKCTVNLFVINMSDEQVIYPATANLHPADEWSKDVD